MYNYYILTCLYKIFYYIESCIWVKSFKVKKKQKKGVKVEVSSVEAAAAEGPEMEVISDILTEIMKGTPASPDARPPAAAQPRRPNYPNQPSFIEEPEALPDDVSSRRW